MKTDLRKKNNVGFRKTMENVRKHKYQACNN